MKNSTFLSTDNYSKTPTVAYDILCQYKNLDPQRQAHTPTGTAMFVHRDNANSSKKVPGNDGRLFADVMCYRCQEMGNYTGNFPSSTANTSTESQSLQVKLTTTQTETNIPETDITNPN